jgi:hypothetical protein
MHIINYLIFCVSSSTALVSLKLQLDIVFVSVLEYGRTDLMLHGGLSRKINSRNSFNYSVQKLLPSRLPPRTLTISMYRDIRVLDKIMETL